MKARIFMCNVLLNRKNSNELGGRLRMTRKLLSVVLACICAVVVGCGDQNVEKTQTLTNKVEEKESNDLTEQETPASIKEDAQSKDDTSPVAEEEKVDSYQFSTSIYQNGHLSIEYPLLTQMVDGNKEHQMNELLEQEATKYVTRFEDDDTTLNMDHQVIINTQNILSILYIGNYNGGMYPTQLLFTTNINLKEGKKIRLSDVFSINERFVEQFKQAPYIDWENPSNPNKEKQAAVVEYLNGIKQQELMNAFKQADDPSIEDNPYGIYSYFKEDFLIISIQVPHALGDHAEFKMNVE
jgi:hypothetical protein